MTPDVKLEIMAAEHDACEALFRRDKTERGTIIRTSDVIGPIQTLIRNLAVLNVDESLNRLADETRISLVIDTNVCLMRACLGHNRASEGGALLAFPAKELLKSTDQHEPCNWKKRWSEEGGNLFKGRMIAPAWDGIWLRLSQFGIPVAPFAPGSGMITKPISRRDSIELGVMTRETQTEPVAQVTYRFTDWTID
jgi:hypothetical protein